MRRTAVAGLVVVAQGFLLLGCSTFGTDEPSSPPAAITSRTPSPTPTPTPSKLRITKGLTKPGTVLKFGQQARVPTREQHGLDAPYTYGVLGIVVHRIEQAPGSSVEGNFDADERKLLKSATAYYAKITVTNESGDLVSPVTADRFEAAQGGKGSGGFLLIGGQLPACRQEPRPFPKSFGHKGARWEDCKFGLSTASQPIREIHYKGPPYGEDAEVRNWKTGPESSYGVYDDLGAIVWR
jgi:hypothetical protein